MTSDKVAALALAGSLIAGAVFSVYTLADKNRGGLGELIGETLDPSKPAAKPALNGAESSDEIRSAK